MRKACTDWPPAAAESFEYGDLILNESAVRGGHRGIRRDQRLLRGQQIEVGRRTGEQLIVREIESSVSFVLSFRQGLPAIELRAIACQRLLRLLERLQHHPIEARERRSLVGPGLTNPCARPCLIRKAPIDRRPDAPNQSRIMSEFVDC